MRTQTVIFAIVGGALALFLGSLARLPQVVEGVAMLEPGRSADAGPWVVAKVTRPIGWTPAPIVALSDTAGEPRVIRVQRVRLDAGRLAVQWGALALATVLALALALRARPAHPARLARPVPSPEPPTPT